MHRARLAVFAVVQGIGILPGNGIDDEVAVLAFRGYETVGGAALDLLSGSEPKLILFFDAEDAVGRRSAGFPTLDTFWGIIEELDANGADVIEIGVPFSDPVADGPVVEDASRRALEQGVSLNWIMDGLKQRAGNFKAGIVLMGYLNPFLQYGLERFAADATQAGVSGCIVPDLPLDESAPVRTTLKAHGIDLIALVGQNTSEERMREYAAVSEGYVYVVSVLGTTGARTGLPPQVEETLRRARKAFNLPLALGFGLQHPDQLAAIPADIRPDAAVFGSALLKHLDKGNTAKAFLEVWTR